jgi:hypothetical protein
VENPAEKNNFEKSPGSGVTRLGCIALQGLMVRIRSRAIARWCKRSGLWVAHRHAEQQRNKGGDDGRAPLDDGVGTVCNGAKRW